MDYKRRGKFMCGIVGYCGKENGVERVLYGLKRLEYRGYDSAGLACFTGARLKTVRAVGEVKRLAEAAIGLFGGSAIGHTRWATTGAVTKRNCHPHRYGGVSVVHNGIIENYSELKAELMASERFSSDTDSEVITHLMARRATDLLDAALYTVKRLRGSFSYLAVSEACGDGEMVGVRMKSPLIFGQGTDGGYFASDLSALPSSVFQIYVLNDGEILCYKGDEATLYDFLGNIVSIEYCPFSSRGEDMREGEHTEAEIDETADALERTFENLREYDFAPIRERFLRAGKLWCFGCGTAFNSLEVMRERLLTLGIETESAVASEFSLAESRIKSGDIALFVTQSGETADTLFALRQAKARGAVTVVITNCAQSSACREADFALLTSAGREVGVAATKTFSAQLLAIEMLVRGIAKEPQADVERLISGVKNVLERKGEIKEKFAFAPCADSAIYIGKGRGAALAREGSLKLKEISYVFSDGYPAGELKHGTLALVSNRSLIVAILEKSTSRRVMLSAEEAAARGAVCRYIAESGEGSALPFESVFVLPYCENEYLPILFGLTMQLVALYASKARGLNPDKPRNLAKCVTVE